MRFSLSESSTSSMSISAGTPADPLERLPPHELGLVAEADPGRRRP